MSVALKEAIFHFLSQLEHFSRGKTSLEKVGSGSNLISARRQKWFPCNFTFPHSKAPPPSTRTKYKIPSCLFGHIPLLRPSGTHHFYGGAVGFPVTVRIWVTSGHARRVGACHWLESPPLMERTVQSHGVGADSGLMRSTPRVSNAGVRKGHICKAKLICPVSHPRLLSVST